MIISIWRYSHLMLAISSFVFILIASITGIILAFEPISEQLKPYSSGNIEHISLSQTIEVLEKEYDEIISLERDHNDFIIATVITKEGSDDRFYINPITGKKLGEIIEKAPMYKFATNLHRSLFLKTTGRIVICIMSFFLFLIAVTGLVLIMKRQGGFLKLFSKIVKEDFNQYYHVVIGRLTLIPIIIITLTGVYLSLEKFSLLPKESINHNIAFKNNHDTMRKSSQDFKIFQNTSLANFKALEFPFSEDVEDYFYLKLKDKELVVQQYSGAILSEVNYPLVTLISSFSLNLHTGRGSILWSLILLLATSSILFFIYSGFAMTLQRKKRSTLIPLNHHRIDEAEYLILVGSETGSTYKYAKLLTEALNKLEKKVFIGTLNEYQFSKSTKQLIVLTSTYGQGEAPSNGSQFLERIKKELQKTEIQFSVVGFGSHSYPDFCQFAIDIDSVLLQLQNFHQVVPIHKIHNQSFMEFSSWANKWSAALNLPIKMEDTKETSTAQIQEFKITNKTNLNEDNTFLIQLQPKKKIRYQSGDLLKITPSNDNVPRYYSMGSTDQDILLSIKKHEFGVCSRYLNQLNIQETIIASIEKNKEFHFPKKNREVILISNGTGIAPFLGMINENKKQLKTHLFWGGRTCSSFDLYKTQIEQGIRDKRLSSVHLAYSREREEQYVQHLIEKNSELVVRVLSQKGIIMICGSLAMESGVKEALEFIVRNDLHSKLEKFSNQIKTDCY